MKRKIITLCGSTRFYEAFQEANYRLTMDGHIVLSVGFYPGPTGRDTHGETVGCTEDEKRALDILHFDKIAMSDSILVLDVGGYVGDSTRNEIAFALATGKRIDSLVIVSNHSWMMENAADLGARMFRLADRGLLPDCRGAK